MQANDHERSTAARDAGLGLRARRADVRALGALAGLDGFVDTIIRAVRRRTAPGAAGFEPMATIEAFADRVRSGAGRSANIELFVERVKLGGNGVLLGNALLALGARVTYAGNLGPADGSSGVHPVFAPFVERCDALLNLGPTGFTDAIEFDDGKLMLGKIAGLEGVTFESLVRAAGGPEGLARLVGSVRLFSMGNWRALPGMTGVWRGLAREVLPALAPASRPAIFVDLADPSERSDADLSAGLDALAALDELTPVTLGLNAAESARIARLRSAGVNLGERGDPAPGALLGAAEALRSELGLACVVCHQRRSAAASEAGRSASFLGPFVRHPKLSTGAGDHFNAGFALAGSLGMSLVQRLATGCACSGWYVRHAAPPTLDELAGFLESLPEPEPDA